MASWRKCIGVGALLLGASSAGRAQEPTFDLGYAGVPCDGTQNGAPGAAYSATVDCTLTTSNAPDDAGAQGWSVSMSSEGVVIDSITTAGTIAAPVPDGLQNGGFEKSETTTGDGNEGAVSAVVLSFGLPVTLPNTGTQVIAKIDVSGAFPAEGDTTAVRIFYVEGRRGSGQPVENNVTWKGLTVKPSLGECAYGLFSAPPPPNCPPTEGAGPWVIFQSQAIGEAGHQVADLNAEIVPTPDPLQPGELEVAPGAAALYAGIVSNGLANGVQGWSLGVGFSGTAELTGATTAGTAGAPAPDGLQNGGFEKTELIDPSLGGQGPGAVSAVVLSFGLPVTLLTTGTATVLALEVTGDLDETASLAWTDGLRGSGQPVDNVATVNGTTATYTCQQSVNITFAEAPVSAFIAGEVNSDARIDIADPIYIINSLFRDGPAVACPAAGDANNDGMIDLADALYIIEYLWMGGSAPVGPAECAVPKGTTPEDCPAGSTSCA